MFQKIGLWLLMTIGFSFLYLFLGFEDTIFLLAITILYLLIINVKRLEPPPARTIMVASKNCDICQKPRALEDLVPVVGSNNFPSGRYEWKMYVCRDNQDCRDKALVEVKEKVKEEIVRRSHGKKN